MTLLLLSRPVGGKFRSKKFKKSKAKNKVKQSRASNNKQNKQIVNQPYCPVAKSKF